MISRYPVFLPRTLDIPDLNLPQVGVLVLLEVDVDGEMGVDVAHLVLEALCDTDDHVVDERADCSQAGDLFAHTMVELDVDGVWLGACESDREMAEVLYKLA
jgi:hypothetical protein